MCQRALCMACAQPDHQPLPGCEHGRLERHEGAPEALRFDEGDDFIKGEAPTKLMPPLLGGTIDVDLADTEAAAEFLEMVARVIRDKKKLRIMIT